MFNILWWATAIIVGFLVVLYVWSMLVYVTAKSIRFGWLVGQECFIEFHEKSLKEKRRK